METNNKIYDFFISHSGAENSEAEILYNMLKQINPEWEIFFDKETLRTENDWKQKMFNAIEHSKHLIFLAKKPETLKIGNGWVSREVDLFYDAQTTKMKYGKEHLNVSYFGITYGWDMEKDLFSDPEHGSEYRAIYKTPNHLFLNQNDTIADFANTISEKVLNMTSTSVNRFPSLILDRTYKYTSVKEGEDENFRKERIIENIIPQLSSNGEFFTFDDILSIVEKKDISIIGAEGGSGKTTMMTKMFFHFLEKACNQNPSDALIPIYIEASTLAGPDYFIMRNIAKNLYNETTATSFTNNETANIISALEKEFSCDRSVPNYLLLIDGYNEIPDGILSKFNAELKEYGKYSKYKNVRIVISGRDIDYELFRDFFKEDYSTRYNIERIDNLKVKDFLKERGLSTNISGSLMNILSIPMYLTMYANMTTEDIINNRSDLLNSFVERQIRKDKETATDENQIARYRFFLKSLLPFIAFNLVTKDSSDLGSFVFSYDEIFAITNDARKYFTSDDYKGYLGTDGRKTLRQSGFEEMDKYSFVDYALDYFLKVSKLLRRDDRDEEKYHFVHQVYRDFFAATHIFNDICFAASTRKPCLSLTTSTSEYDVSQLAIELLNEDTPKLDKNLGLYNYDCNNTSRLIKLIENSRENMQCEDADFLCGVIYLLKIIRKNNLAACDFSGLNLTKSNFCFAALSTFDTSGSYCSTFKNSKINSENLLVNNPASHIMAACTNEDSVAVFDSTGTLSIWKKGVFNNIPLKIVNNISYRLHKIIFSNDNKTIYGMAGHTILEIPIPEGKFGHESNIICKTDTRLRDIFTDSSGEVYFTTVFNSYNPKPISNPNAPDSINFYGINSSSAVRHDKKQVAFGYISGYNGLKLYDFDDERNTWVERKIGIHLLLDEFVIKIETLLKDAGIYEKFYTKKEYKDRFYFKKLENFHCEFFEEILLDVNKEHTDYQYLPGRICNKLLDRMKLLTIPTDKFLPDLIRLKQEAKALISDLEQNNRALAYMHGRKFSSIEYKPGTDTLLVTYYNEYDKNKKHHTHTTVAEINTTDLSTKIIHIHSGRNKVIATYSGDDIVITTREKLWVADRNGNFYSFPVIYGNNPRYFYSECLDSFYMTTNTAVYEFNEDFVCTKNLLSNFSRENYSLVIANGSTPYLVLQRAIDVYNIKLSTGELTAEQGLYMYNLKNGKWEEVSKMDSVIPGKDRVLGFFGKTVTDKSGTISLYNEGVAERTIPLQRNLHIAGCDFTGISGTLTEPEYLDILNFYGALTDQKTEKLVAEKIKPDFSFTPSDIPFEEPEEFKNFVSPYIFTQNEQQALSTEELSPVKDCQIWSKIQKGSNMRNSFEPSDFSILEWIGWLDILTPEMIYFLMEADQIEKPSVYSLEKNKITKRMHKTLFQNLRLLLKHSTTKSNTPLYTLNKYPKILLPQVTGAHYKKQPSNLDNASKVSKILLLNLWYSYTLMKLKEHVVAQRDDVLFETENLLTSQEKIIRRYIKLDNGALFARIIRGALDERKIMKNQKRIQYFCELASNYPYLMCNGINQGITAAPTIVIICEDFECCKTLNDAFENISPHIRKVYTYDALMTHCIKNDSEDMYVEFKDKKAYKVSMNDLV